MKLLVTTPILLLCFYYIPLYGFEVPSLESQMLQFPITENPLQIPLHFMAGVPTVSISIGTPPQEISAVFDTSSLVSWIMSDECNSTACSGVDDKNKFHRKQSTTNTDLGYSVSIPYIDGSYVRVRMELDTLTIIDPISFPRHLIGEATDVYYPSGYPSAASGRFGVGDFGAFAKYMASAQGIIKEAEKIAQEFLSRAVGDDRTSSGYAASGSPDFKKRDGVHAPFYWTLGSDPEKYTGTIYELQLMAVSGKVLSPFWKLPIRGIKLINYQKSEEENESTKATESPSSALIRLELSDSSFGIIDSSTPYLHLPRHLSQALNEKLGAQYDSSLKLYTVDCERRKHEPLWLIFEFNGIDALIPSHQYMIERHQQCHTAIVDATEDHAGEDDSEIRLGGPFFRSFYLEYHTMARKIGIAESTAKLGLLRQPSSSGSYDLLDVDVNEIEVPV